MTRSWKLTVVSFWVFLIAIVAPAARAQEPQDVIARVGDQTISLHEIDTMINSSTVVGLDIPAPGTPERNAARLSLLDKMISADLLYLDALKTGLDKNPDYQQKVKTFEDNVLVSLYKEKVLKGDLPVSESEVRDYYKKNIAAGTELTDDVKLGIEATIRKEKFKARNEGMRQKIRQGVKVTVVTKELEPAGDSSRKASVIVARVNSEEIHWGEVKASVTSGAGKDPQKQRMNALDGLIDERIMAAKAREMGLEKDPVFQARVNEFKKTSLVNLHQGMLFKKFSPQDSEVRSYYEKNKNKIIQPEVRNVQMVVLKTRKEAEDIKKRIKSKKMTFFEAARDYSIDPNAKQNLGQIGWVKQGTGFPDLDKLTFSLKKDQLGGPAETPVGWHLVKVLDIRDALYTNIKDKKTLDQTRRTLMHEKLDQYTAKLRKEKFTVTVYEDVFGRLVDKEAKTITNEAAR
ncbi:MAG: peptidyl-prolyl cis-trans isomerase [Nitrospirae bacterium]|nr:peptidyl-prolyl cis-trans isomerase [Nitrospirota bacterium]